MSAALPGVSFIVRVKNEEPYLRACLESLQQLTIPHEIIVILHTCTDGSRAIAESVQASGQPVRIIEWSTPMSRPGYENLVTPADHPSSASHFCNMCFSLALYKWTFKWDADFTATPELLGFLNTSLDLGLDTPTSYQIQCQLGDEASNCENYLFNSLEKYRKELFWEFPEFKTGTQFWRIECRILSIPPLIVKTYWHEEPWFLHGVDADLETKYARLNDICGKDIPGLARARNPTCDHYNCLVVLKEAELACHGIFLRK